MELKEAYSRMHAAVRASQVREQGLLERASTLTQKLQAQTSELEQQSDVLLTDQSERGQLRREMLRSSNELSMAQTREDELRVRTGCRGGGRLRIESASHPFPLTLFPNSDACRAKSIGSWPSGRT